MCWIGLLLQDSPSHLLLLVMSKWIVGIIMRVLVPSFALQRWTGTTLSMLLNCVYLIVCST
jgi:hypothetical protein